MSDTTIRQMQARVHHLARQKGWWDPCSLLIAEDASAGHPMTQVGTPDREGPLDHRAVEKTLPEKLCLIHSEVSEALEDYRTSRMQTFTEESGKLAGLPTELADIAIRVMDLCGGLGIDLQSEIEKKHAFNETRAFRHGGKKA